MSSTQVRYMLTLAKRVVLYSIVTNKNIEKQRKKFLNTIENFDSIHFTFRSFFPIMFIQVYL